MKNIRFANIKDIPAICNIYTYYVEHSVATFAYQALSEQEWVVKLVDLQKEYPFLVYEMDGIVTGYAYATCFRSKEAYDWDVELSIYMHPDYVQQHCGSSLMKALLDILKVQHFQVAYACITLPNKASMALHQKLGFQQIATFKRTGYKFEKWHDIAWMEYMLVDIEQPLKILSIQQCNQETLQEICSFAI